MEKLNYTKASEFVPINKLVLKDNEELKKIKSIYKKEAEYAQFLGPIESFIATYYYYDNPKIYDLDVSKSIENIRANWEESIDFFKSVFEKELMGVISFALQNAERKITRYELFLVLGYILWSIDNRRWLGDKRGYLNWLCDFFDLYDKDEKKKFNSFYDGIGETLGIDKEKLKAMKNQSFENTLSAKEDALNIADAQKFATYNTKATKTEIEDDDFWKEGSFFESMSSADMKNKMRTFHMKHNEEMNYNCKKCNKKISAHNKDWHAHMCDDCFDKKYFKN